MSYFDNRGDTQLFNATHLNCEMMRLVNSSTRTICYFSGQGKSLYNSKIMGMDILY